ncbi:MAG TPA: hypothetical protein VH351_09150 [Bryobacteraceae bacterium]|jgi:hypothetical protein|nr:hypothetical protein [Bryobacteraceae bacterium]
MWNLSGKKESEDVASGADSIFPVYDDHAEYNINILRGLFFAAGPTAAFWLSLILGIKLLLL